MSDIVDRLRHPMMRSTAATMAESPPGLMMIDQNQAIADMAEAANEIERLRGLAGAVTTGPGLADIRKDVSV